MARTISAPSTDVEKEALEIEAPEDSFPDGGLQAWICVAGGSTCLFVTFGWINCIGVFQDYYQLHQLRDYSPSQVAWITCLQAFFMLICGPFVGTVFDASGPRWLLFTGTSLHVFGLMMASLSSTYYQFLLSQAICSPIGASMVYYAAINCVATWFFVNRGIALGLTAAGASLGGVILPIMVTKLIPKVGFGWAMRSCAFLILALLLFANLTVTSRIAPTRHSFSPLAFMRPLRELPFAFTVCGTFLFFWGMFVPFSFLILEARTRGMSQRLADYLLPIVNAAGIFGRIIPGLIGDKVGRYNVMVVMCAFTGVLLLALWLPATANTPIILFAALFGIGSGGSIGLIPALIAQISDVREIGMRTGTVFAISAFAALTSGPIAGQIIGKLGFRNAQIFAGVACSASSLCFLAARVAIGGFKVSKKV